MYKIKHILHQLGNIGTTVKISIGVFRAIYLKIGVLIVFVLFLFKLKSMKTKSKHFAKKKTWLEQLSQIVAEISRIQILKH